MGTAAEDVEPELYPAEVGFLPPKFVTKAELELFETPQRKKYEIEQVRKLMRRDSSVREEWFTDDNIVMYLRCKKYDARRAFASIKRMVHIIKKHAKIFERVDIEELVNNMNTDMARILPYRDKDGSVIVLSKLREWEPSELDSETAVVYLTLVFLHALSDPMSQVNGVRILYDFKANFLKYVRYTTPMRSYFLYQIAIESVPMRIKMAHGINPNGLTKLFLTGFLLFVSEKVKKRIKMHDDAAELLDYLPASSVPNEYGGQLTREGRLCPWSQKVKIPDYISNILKSVNSKR